MQTTIKKMRPTKIIQTQQDLFKASLNNLVDLKDPLIILSNSLNWSKIECKITPLFKEGPGRPPKPVRLIIGLLILQHINGISDAVVVKDLKHNIYWQYFCGFSTLQTNGLPDASSLTRWRNKIGIEGLKTIHKIVIETCIKTGYVKPKELKKVIVDTTVMEKNITYPTDSKLLNKIREKITSWSQSQSLKLRQTYKLLGKRLLTKVNRYAHAKQYKRVKKSVSQLRTYLGRAVRDIKRKVCPDMLKIGPIQTLLILASRLLSQTKTSKDKVYSIHEPSTYCISKGKSHKKYEYGSKVSLVTTHKQGLVLYSESLETNIHDSKTLSSSLSKTRELTGSEIEEVFVDKGYRGHREEKSQVYISGQKRLSPPLKKRLKRRSSIEPHIGHMKSEGKLGKNYLKGIRGDKVNSVLCGIGHNMRLLLSYLSKTTSNTNDYKLSTM